MYHLIPSNMTWLEVESLPPSLQYWPGLANFIFVNILCSIATASIPLRLYTYLCLTKKKGGWALIWTTVAWVSIPPSVAFFFYGEAWLLVVTTSIAPLWPLIKRLKWTRKHDKSESVESMEAVESMES
ncbi:hypothetical protein N7488_001611 [Penicillium malachiteum]|nr:hypothetical protein N7488_001611 [Penicillium malachiteum]